MTDAPRRWLGDAGNRRHVIDNLDRMVIRPAQEGTGRPAGAQYGQLGSSLTETQRRALKEEIELHGEVLVAEGAHRLWHDAGISPRGLVPQAFAVRLFVAGTAEGLAVMPGGLAMAIVPNLAVALSAPEPRTRDVWIIADGEVPPHRSLWQPTIETARVQRSQRVIQSRVADDLFWLGRYAERADWIMRVLRSALQPLRGDSGPSQVQGAARACRGAGDRGARAGTGGVRHRRRKRRRGHGAPSHCRKRRPPHARRHPRQALSRVESHPRPAVARSMARAEPLPPGGRLAPCDRRFPRRRRFSTCSRTASGGWRLSTVSSTRT
ncbi:MAG: circularly permuted type 2 ATP-grasp protein [Hyphomicrobium sp.]